MLFATADMFAMQKPPLVDCPVVFLNGACVRARARVCVCVCVHQPDTCPDIAITVATEWMRARRCVSEVWWAPYSARWSCASMEM
jgi:hypothetical protein